MSWTKKICLLIVLACLVESQWWKSYPAVQLTKTNIDELIGGDKHVYLKFFTPWCHWCQTMAPDWNQLYQLYHQDTSTRKDITVAKVNCETDPQVCHQFHVHSYPIVYYFPIHTKEPEHGFSGYRPFEHIQHFVQETIGDQTEHNRVYHGGQGNHDHQHAHGQDEEGEGHGQNEEEKKRKQEEENRRKAQIQQARKQEEERRRREQQEADRIQRQRIQRQQEQRRLIQERILREKDEELERQKLRILKEKEAGQQEFQILSDGPVDTEQGSLNGQVHSIIQEISLLKAEITQFQLNSKEQFQAMTQKMHIVGEELRLIVHPMDQIQQQNNNQSQHHIVNWTHAVIFMLTGSLLGFVLSCFIQSDGRQNTYLPEKENQ